MNSDTNKWAMALHLSCFAGYLTAGAGFIAPIVIWQIKKDDMPEIEAHGRIVANAIISFLIYAAVGLLSIPILIGIPILMILGLVAIAFPIIGAIKASEGMAWKYPGTISIL